MYSCVSGDERYTREDEWHGVFRAVENGSEERNEMGQKMENVNGKGLSHAAWSGKAEEIQAEKPWLCFLLHAGLVVLLKSYAIRIFKVMPTIVLQMRIRSSIYLKQNIIMHDIIFYLWHILRVIFCSFNFIISTVIMNNVHCYHSNGFLYILGSFKRILHYKTAWKGTK
jgi:hypothetical protein